MALFDMPGARSNRAVDKALSVKSKAKSAATVTVKGNSLIDKINLIKQTVEQKLGKYKEMYSLITDEEELKSYIDKCIENGIVAIDTETTGLDPMQDKIAGICIYTSGLNGVYVPINHESYITGCLTASQLSPNAVACQMRRLGEHNVKVIMHNANFDIRVIWYSLGVKLNCYFDTLIASQLLNENEPHGLKVLHQKYVLHGEGDAWSFGKLFSGIPFTKIPITIAYMYAARDPHITYELYEFQLQYLTLGTKENEEQCLQDVQNVFWNIEMPFINVIIEMENNGIALDLEYQAELHDKYTSLKQEKLELFQDKLKDYESEIQSYRLNNHNCKLDEPINIASPVQLSILLYDIIKVGEIDRKTPRGTGEDILQKINTPMTNAILDYRGVDKLISTYIDKLPNCINQKTQKIHCQFNQYGAKTGRLSSENPNMQNIPSHNTDIRKMFVADKGCVIMSADYSQQEVVLFAELSKDKIMIQSITDGKDVYSMIAAVAFNKTYEDCKEFRPDGTTNKEGKTRRSQAKNIVLGILYCREVASIAEQLGVPIAAAQKIKNDVISAFPNFAEFEESTLVMAEQLGYVTTLWGSKRRLPEMQLPMYEFSYIAGHGDTDPLSFDSVNEDLTVPEEVQEKYLRMLKQAGFGRKRKIFEQANEEGIHIIDNERKIADTTRQCVNARVQGSAANLTKLAGIEILNNERLKELGFKLVLSIHDEYLGICPEENAKECSELFSKCMSDAARELSMTIKCDTEITHRWYGEKVEV